jgi:hypothetical protein
MLQNTNILNTLFKYVNIICDNFLIISIFEDIFKYFITSTDIQYAWFVISSNCYIDVQNIIIKGF